MVITSDVRLLGTEWQNALESFSDIFRIQTNYSIFLLSASIGIMYDEQVVVPEGNGEDISSVPRTVLHQHSEDLDFLFQAAILTSRNVEYDENERLLLAFGEEKKGGFDKMKFLTSFANFGVTKLNEKLGGNSLETMENIKDYLASSMEGSNFDINPLPEDIIDLDY